MLEFFRDGTLIDLAKPMAFEVAFVHDPKTKFICNIVHPRIIKLMGCANSVDVVSFHEKEILDHEIVRDSPSMVGVMLVTIDAAKLDWFTVDDKDTIFELSCAESDSLLDCTVWRGDHELIEVWSFGCPFLRVFDWNVEMCVCGALLRNCCDCGSGGIQ